MNNPENTEDENGDGPYNPKWAYHASFHLALIEARELINGPSQ